MIIDFQSDSKTARRYNVLCARTGECLNHWHIFYADDEAGVVRCYVADEAGGLYLNETRDEAVWEERRKAIRIVPKPADELRAIEEEEHQAEVDRIELGRLIDVVRVLHAAEQSAANN